MLKKIKNLQKDGKNISIIVHQKELSEKLALIDISSYYHPIVSANNSDIVKFSDNMLREKNLEKYRLDKDKNYIGCYGFYGPYKGIDIVLRSMSLLPENYHLILSCNVHPIRNLNIRGITDMRKINKDKKKNSNNKIEDDQISAPKNYVEQDEFMVYLMEMILKMGLLNRIHFLNHILDEEEFKELIAATDISIFPYYEVGQQGSGPLSYATHLSNSGKIIISRTNLFETYEKNFFEDCYTFFDQGNYVELSKKIQTVVSKSEQLSIARSKYNPDSNIKTYIDALLSNKECKNFMNKDKIL